MNFKVGQKVYCTHTFTQISGTTCHPIAGYIYTVRDIVNTRFLCLRFDEIINAPHQFSDIFGEAAWAAKYFRPLDEVAHGVVMTFEKLKGVQPIYQS